LPSVILPEKNTGALYIKLDEPWLDHTGMEKRKNFSLKAIHTPDGPTYRIDWENKRRIRNLWTEINGLH
jgi:hypothetical protein